MRHANRRRGMSLIELLFAASIGLMASGLIIQVLVLTMRTGEQTASQADTQQRTRAALAHWESELRDAYAILTDYTTTTASPTTFKTRITPSEQTLVAVLPSLDGNGNFCSWRGTNVVFDCVVWQGLKQNDGTWCIQRYIFANACQMPASYFTASAGRRQRSPFRALLWGQIVGNTTSGTSVQYTVPSSFARAAEPSPSTLFSRASMLTVQLLSPSGTVIAPVGTVTNPPAVPTYQPLPLLTNSSGARTSTAISPTNVATVTASLQFTQSAAALATGHGSVTQSDTQRLSVELRNRPTW